MPGENPLGLRNPAAPRGAAGGKPLTRRLVTTLRVQCYATAPAISKCLRSGFQPGQPARISWACRARLA